MGAQATEPPVTGEKALDESPAGERLTNKNMDAVTVSDLEIAWPMMPCLGEQVLLHNLSGNVML